MATRASSATRVSAARTSKPQGQWALGDRTPLNASEEVKHAGDGLDVRERIERIYAVEGYDSIAPDDLKERFKWWGLYTQRRQDQPASATQTADVMELADRYFMLRIRSDGGQLTVPQARAIASVSTEFGRDVADVTDRQNIQLHWIRIEDMPEIWRRLEAVGLSTAMACGDVPRGFLGCPLAGRAADEVIDATPVLEAVTARAVGNHAFSNLPRKYKTSISGCSQRCAQPDLNDVAFVAVRGPDGAPVFDVWVGGGLGSSPHFAQRLGVGVTADEVPDVWEAITLLFRDYGYRRNRKRARLKFLVADWGADRVRETLEREYLERPLTPLPAVQAPTERAGTRASGASGGWGSGDDHVGITAQRDGRVAIGLAPRVGRLTGTQLAGLADLAERHGGTGVHLTTQQKIVLVDIAADAAGDVVDALEQQDLRARPSAFRRGAMACTGLEFCKLALAETKHTALTVTRELEERLPQWDEPLRIHINGCPNSCARFQVADIGLMGALVPHADGSRGPGFLVHLGGHVEGHRAFAAKAKGVRVPADDVVDYLETLLRRYLVMRDDDQTFTTFIAALDDDGLTSFAALQEPQLATAST
jgi:sulfite reductase (ferredoxin)